jgi:hypothetical protein
MCECGVSDTLFFFLRLPPSAKPPPRSSAIRLRGNHLDSGGATTLDAMHDSSFARAILAITLELIAKLGAKWHGAHCSAHNKAAFANVMSKAVLS